MSASRQAVGALAGWIAGKLMQGGGFGFVVNFVVGIIGAVLGGAIFDALHIDAYGKTGNLVTAVVGAIVLLWFISLFKKST